MFLIVTADTLAVNGLQLGDVANECELRSIGKIEFFRENNVPVFRPFGNDRLAAVGGRCVNSRFYRNKNI